MTGHAVARPNVSEEDLSPRDFRFSMPESYRKNFDVAASDAHQQVSSERGSSSASIGTFSAVAMSMAFLFKTLPAAP